MTAMTRLLLGLAAPAVVVSTGTIDQRAEASATGTTAVLVNQVETGLGFTAPLGSDKGSVTNPRAAQPLAPTLLGEEPIYYPGS
jgi:hypothetical protein